MPLKHALWPHEACTGSRDVHMVRTKVHMGLTVKNANFLNLLSPGRFLVIAYVRIIDGPRHESAIQYREVLAWCSLCRGHASGGALERLADPAARCSTCSSTPILRISRYAANFTNMLWCFRQSPDSRWNKFCQFARRAFPNSSVADMVPHAMTAPAPSHPQSQCWVSVAIRTGKIYST